MGPEIKLLAEEPPNKKILASIVYVNLLMNFKLAHLKMNGESNKKNKEQENTITRRTEAGFEVSLKQEAVMKISFEDKVEGNKITR